MNMFSTKFLPGVFAAVVLGASPCIADGDFYDDSANDEFYKETAKESGVYALVGAGMGDSNEITYTNTDFNVAPGFSWETGIGYRFNPNLRVEATYGQNKFDVDHSALIDHMTAKSFFLTGLYDIDNDSKLTPYVGLGIGSTNLDTDASTDDNDTSISYQGKGGISYDLTDKIDVYGELTYQIVDDTNIGDTNVDSIKIWRGQLGLRFYF